MHRSSENLKFNVNNKVKLKNRRPMRQQIKQIDFTGQNFYCGIDTHKKNWAVTIATDDFQLKTFSQNPDPKVLVQHLKKKYPGGRFIVGYEAGYFGFGIQRELQAMGVECKVINPADIPTTNKDKDQKRDPRDSRKIANSLKNNDVSSVWIPPVSLEQDRLLVRTRKTISKDLSRTKNRIRSLLQVHSVHYPEVFRSISGHWSNRFITWLESVSLHEPTGTEALKSLVRQFKFQRSELVMITRQIRLLARTDRYKNAYSALIKISGIGLVTAMAYLTEVGDIERFKNTDNFRSFIGLIPRSHSSGEKDYHGRITNRANSYLRYLLVEAAWTAIRNDPHYLHLYKQYLKNMKGNKAIIRVAGKIANRIFYCLKNEVEK
jgi:transposase